MRRFLDISECETTEEAVEAGALDTELYDPRYDCEVRLPRRRGEFSAASYQRLWRTEEDLPF